MTRKKVFLLLILILTMVISFTACSDGESEYVKVSFYVDGEAYRAYWVKTNECLNEDVEVPDKEGMIGVWSVTDFDCIEADMRVDAIYTSATCTITFVVDNTTIATLAVTKNSSPSNIPEVPEKEGYNGDWNYTDFSNIAQDITVSAVYTPIVCTISFMNGTDVYATRVVDYGNTLTDIPTIPSTPYSYSSQWVGEENSEPDYTNIKSNIIIYAYYYLTITTSGSYNEVETVDYDLNQEVTEISPGVKDGYDFYGWYYDEELECQISFPLIFEQNIEIYARWLKTSDADDFTFVDGKVESYLGSDTEIVIPYKYTDNESTVYVTSIGSNAFNESSAITSISIPGTVTEFYDYAFNNCSSLIELNYPDQNNVEIIGDYAFSDCSSMISFYAGTHITEIGEYAFNNCSSIENITLGTVNTIGSYALSNITTVATLTIPSTITNISEGAFKGMVNTVFTFSDNSNLTTVGNMAFENCANLTEFNATSLQNMGINVFGGCSSLKTISMISNSYFYKLFNNTIMDNSYEIVADEISYYVPKSVVNVNVVSNIGYQSGYLIENAFLDAYYVKNVTLVGDFTIIKQNAFKLSDADSITSNTFTITISSKLTKIDDYAFTTRNDLKSISLPASLYEIGEYAFYDIDVLASVSISTVNGLSVIGKNAFTGTAWLTEYSGVARLGKIAIGFGTNYIASGSRVSLVESDLESITSIAPNAFENLSSLQEITIPSTILSIGENAFSNCLGLKTIVFPIECTSIGNNALSGCSYLEEVTIGLSADLDNIFGNTDYSNTYIITREELVDEVLTSVDYYVPSSLIELTLIADETIDIAKDRYSNYSSLTSIILEDGIEKIYDGAFENNSSLESISIPTSLTDIGILIDQEDSYIGAFSGCGVLTSITIPVDSSLTNIYDYAFMGTSINYLLLPSTVEYIGNYAFSNTKLISLSFVTGDESLVIEDYAFSNISTFNSSCNIVFPDNLVSIGNYAFYNDTTLSYVTLNEQLSSVGSYAFASCNLKRFTLPSNVQVYEEDTCLITGILQDNSNILSLTLSNGVTIEQLFIENYPVNLTTVTINGGDILAEQFKNVTSLQVVSLSAVTSIGDYAFYGCNNANFISIKIPATVQSIGDYAFSECSNLSSFLILSGSELELVGEYVFENDSKIKQVVIPDTVTNTTWNGTFNNCTSLTTTNIPLYVEDIGDYTFNNCSSLTEIDIPEAVTAIGNNAFYNCSSTSFGNTNFEKLLSIGENAFYNCIKMQSFKAEYIESIGDNAFSGCTDMTEITIVNGAPSNYVTNIDKLNTINISSKATTLSSGAFALCENLETIFFANRDNSTTLQEMLDVLDGDGYLTTNTSVFIYKDLYAELSSNIENYDINVISYPIVLASEDYSLDEELHTATIIASSGVSGIVYIPQVITVSDIEYIVVSIGEEAFKDNTSITSVIIPSSITSIGQDAFCNCTNLTSVSFEAGSDLEEISGFVFDCCSALTNITLPDSVTTIGVGAFNMCTSLESVYTTRNSNLTTINEYAFASCENLTYFDVPSQPTYYTNSFAVETFVFTIIGN
jgi:hypothetical protein